MASITKTRASSFLLAIICCLAEAQFEPPSASVEPLKPAGLRVSIPHEDGMSLVAFHVKFNEDFEGLEAGTIARDIVKKKDNRWTYQDKTTKLKAGDVVYYWIHVVYRGLGYNLLDQQHVVSDFYDYQGQRVSGAGTQTGGETNGCQASSTRVYDERGYSLGRQPCIGDILLDENFRNGDNQFNRSQWTIVEEFAGTPDYEFVVYRNSRTNVIIGDGLKIIPKPTRDEFSDDFVRSGNLTLDRCTGTPDTNECHRTARGWNILPPVTSGRLNTNKFLNFIHGRVEIRAKLPRGDWIYPLLMLQSAKKSSDAQIRVASSIGNADLKTRQGNDLSGHTLWAGLVNLKSQKTSDNRFSQERAIKRNNDLWSKNFHIYELLWSPGKVVVKVDGEKFEEKSVEVPKDTPFFLTIGVAVGGITEFPDQVTSNEYSKPWRNVEAKAPYNFYNASDKWSKTWQGSDTSLEVDYLKVWAL